MTPQPSTTTTKPPNGNGQPHCTICGLILPAHKPGCKHDPANKPAPSTSPVSPVGAPKNDTPRTTWSGIATTLKAAHLQGKPRTLTIRAVKMEETMPQPGHPKQTPVLYFKEQPQKFILGEGNQTALMEMFGDDMGACVGKQITIVPVKWGKKTICRITRPGEGATPPPPEVPNEATPF